MKINDDIINILNINKSDLLTINILLEKSGYKDDEQLEIILLMMFSGKNSGSSCLILNSDYFYENVKKFNISFDVLKFIAKINDNFYKNIISVDINNYKPIYYLFSNDNHYLYFHKYYKNEIILKSLIDKLIEKQNNISINEEIFKKIDIIISKNYKGLILNDLQKTSVILAILNNFLIISGGPGSGKTTTIIIIILTLLNTGFNYKDIALIAPTGKASNMLKESIINFNMLNDEKINSEELMISTIHRLLKYNPSKKIFSYNKKNKLPLKVIIIDEVSMVDLIIMTDLLEALNENVKVIFIGDKDQLPSVDVGSVLSDFLPLNIDLNCTEEYLNIIKLKFNLNINLKINSNKFSNKIIILEGNNRTKNITIKKISELINKQDESVINYFEKKKSYENNIFFNNSATQIVPSADKKSEIKILLRNWIEHYYYKIKIDDYTLLELIEIFKKYNFNNNNNFINMLDTIFKFLSYSKILTVVKNGIFGSNSINNFIYEVLLEKIKKNRSNYLISGTPVIITVNDYTNQLYNGEIGIILEDKNNNKKIFFKRYSDYKDFNVEKISCYETCFSMTVHKSQGSGYNNIFFILPDNIDNKLLTKEIFYTAITRSINSLTLYADDDIIKKAINQKITRQSGFNYTI